LTRGVKRRHELVHGSSIRYPKAESATGESEAGSSASIRSRVVAARRVQEDRLAGELIHCNAQMGVREIERHCRIDDATRALLHKAMETRSMSARGAHRVLRVARTIADLAGEADIGMENVAEALQYQSMNRAGEYG
jgi:magnesium chelatase family protein